MKIKYISLVNLIVDREVVRELIQHECNVDTAAEALEEILPGGRRHAQMEQDLQALHQQLGGPGASARAAQLILKA